MSTIFPAYLRLEHQPGGNAQSSFLAEVNSALAPAEKRFQNFSAEAQRLVDQALSVQRNAGGSFDLDVAGMRAAAQAQESRAATARQLAAAMENLRQTEGDTSQQARLSAAAMQALAIEEEEAARATRAHAAAVEQLQAELNQTAAATDQVVRSSARGSAAQGALTRSSGASRTAFVQLGQQMQDVTVQAQMGTNAFTIFAQQVPQAAFALSGLADSANKTQASIGRFATFMAGPWGAAIFAATAILGPFVYGLLQAEEATSEAEFATYRFSDAQNILGSVIDLTTGKINTQSEALLSLARAQALAGQVEARRSQAEARTALQDIEAPGLDLGAALRGRLRERGGAEKTIAEEFLAGDRTADAAVRELERLQEAGRITEQVMLDTAEAITSLALGTENEAVFADALAALDGDRSALTQFLRPPSSRGGGSSGAGRAEREAERLATFGEQAAERIARLNEQFDRQPKLIDQAARSTRELETIIAELAERRPPDFEALIASAEAARGVIDEALVRPFAELEQSGQRQVEIESLLLGGREREATILQEIWRIESQLGPLSARQADAVAEIVENRQDELEIIQRLREEQDGYLSATKSVRSEIEAIFAGRGDIGNFQQIFRDLQARSLTDRIFGDALEELDDSVKAQFDRAVTELELGADRATLSFRELADAASAAAYRMNNPAAADAYAAFQANFDAQFGAAENTIVVNGTSRRLETGIAAMTPEPYAAMLSQAIAGPIVDELNAIFGTQFFDKFERAIGGAFYGFSTAGPIGGILGGAQGLLAQFGESAIGRDLATTLNSYLGGALQGAQTGTLISGLGNALGINTSGLGASLGGAVGSIFGGPVGSLVGSIGGSLIEKFPILGGLAGHLLFGGSKRGSAILDGGGITGYYGNSSSRKDTAGTLAGSVFEGIDSIADQLGAQVNRSAGRVSIGIRDGNYRVDRAGRGYTKLSGNPEVMDFGEDAEAAVRAAVMDLVRDGVISGIRASTQRLLLAGDDLEAALQDALDFEDVFTRLARHKDPVGAALDELDTEFEGLKDLFERAGASTEEWADLEELYWLERDEIVKEAMERSLGQLRGFLDEITVGNDALSLRNRRSMAVADFDPLAERVAAGDATAFDDFVEAARVLLDIERELFGSTQDYFERLDQVTGLSQSALDGAEGAAFAASNRDSPFGAGGIQPNDNAGIIAGVDRIVDQIANGTNARLDAVNANLGALLAQGRGGSRSLDFGLREASW
ncbi:MAG: hypothetical protein JY451_01695 [Erythrobacter sp.]|nr:MAG: hypothetical protein JY451_01695 [Erythrobacter sp.]